ncbi:MAG: hypothetical protein ACYC6N_17315 [Pirellulaceae bacterium]
MRKKQADMISYGCDRLIELGRMPDQCTTHYLTPAGLALVDGFRHASVEADVHERDGGTPSRNESCCCLAGRG